MVNWFEPLQETNQPSLLSSALLERGRDTVSWSPRGPQLQLIFPLQPDGAREGGGELQEEEGGPELLGLGYRAGWTSFAYSGPRATSQGPLISATLRSSIDLQNDPIIQKYGYKNVGLTKCLLTKEEMKTFHFPLPGSPNYENFILTKYTGFITDSSPLFGLDCEVCLTSMGKELTRISLVTEGGYCLIDELVKPDLKILDYLTSFTGITKEILNPVTTKLKDVQKLLRELLPPDAVLVGHCLDLDLRVLKMIHPYVIDTSLLYAGKQGRRFKLTFLARVILGKDIQCPNKLGRDGIEDARAALELLQYFLKYGPKKIAEFNLEALAANQEQGDKEEAAHMRWYHPFKPRAKGMKDGLSRFLNVISV